MRESEPGDTAQPLLSLNPTPAELIAVPYDPKNSLAASAHNGPKPDSPEKEDTAHEEN